MDVLYIRAPRNVYSVRRVYGAMVWTLSAMHKREPTHMVACSVSAFIVYGGWGVPHILGGRRTAGAVSAVVSAYQGKTRTHREKQINEKQSTGALAPFFIAVKSSLSAACVYCAV